MTLPALPHNTSRALNCLRAAVFLQVWGFYLTVFGHTSAINTTVFINMDQPESLAQSIDRGGAVVLLVLGAASVWFPRALTLWPIALWMLMVAGLEVYQGAKPFSQWSAVAWAMRYGAPVVFWLWWTANKRDDIKRWQLGEWVARVCMAMTFFAHGVEALYHHPRFIDLLSGAWHRTSALWLSQETAQIVLTVIGVIDMLCAALILVPRLTKWIGGYMAFWGFVTALSRVVEWGSPGMGATLLRASHGLLPLALWLLYRHKTQKDLTTTEASSDDQGA